MTEITTNGKTILLVEVPEDGKDFYINNVGCIRYSVGRWSKCIEPEEIGIYLNNNEYEILGKSTELSEEQMKEIVYEPKKLFAGMYFNYKKGANICTSVQESYLSLLEANGIVDRNQFEKPEIGRDKRYSSHDTSTESMIYHEYWHKRLEQWQKAQLKVKTYLALKRI